MDPNPPTEIRPERQTFRDNSRKFSDFCMVYRVHQWSIRRRRQNHVPIKTSIAYFYGLVAEWIGSPANGLEPPCTQVRIRVRREFCSTPPPPPVNFTESCKNILYFVLRDNRWHRGFIIGHMLVAYLFILSFHFHYASMTL